MPNLGDGLELGWVRSGKIKSRSELGKLKGRSPAHVSPRDPDSEASLLEVSA